MTDAEFPVSPVERVSIFVRELARSLHFYRELLGFELVADKMLTGARVAELVGLEDCTVRVVYLRSERNDFGMIGLFEVRDPPLPEATPPPPTLARGVCVTTFAVSNADELLERLRRADVPVVRGPVRYANPALGAFVEFLALDPDGLPLGFVEFRPARPGLSRTWYGAA